ncbi:kinase subunit of RNA polymerase II carboxy-terminal domain kinase I [Nowakowskiella sp. JEL0078]|nr:kinase subunit of RNA polymerase II carboxy-terminal domain kinase I [Nowakowskiella sp. JEL0078]
MDRLLLAGLQGQVGEGTYGKVYKARCLDSNKLVALKRIRLDFEKEGIGSNWREGFPITGIREIRILASLKHKNVVRFKELVTEEKDIFVKKNGIEKKDKERSVYMVFEFMDSDLAGLLLHPNLNFSRSHIKCLMKQLFEGLDYLHTRKIIHRDIKGANLLMNSCGELKLADFGLARSMAKNSKTDYTNRVITLWYRPPELLLGATKYGPEIDMWSAGFVCVLLELHTRKAVFPGNLEISQLELIWKLCGSPNSSDNTQWPGVVDLPWWDMIKPEHSHTRKIRESFKDLSPQALDLVDKLLQLDPLKRLSAKEVLEHPYFTFEEPMPCTPSEIPHLEGDWHEFGTKQRKKEKEKSFTKYADHFQPSSPGSFSYQQTPFTSNQQYLDPYSNQSSLIPPEFKSQQIPPSPQPESLQYQQLPINNCLNGLPQLASLPTQNYSHEYYMFNRKSKHNSENRGYHNNKFGVITNFGPEGSQNRNSESIHLIAPHAQPNKKQPIVTPTRPGIAVKSYRRDQNLLGERKKNRKIVERKVIPDEVKKSFDFKIEVEMDPDEIVVIEEFGNIVVSTESKFEDKSVKEEKEENIEQKTGPKKEGNFNQMIQEACAVTPEKSKQKYIVEPEFEKTMKISCWDAIRGSFQFKGSGLNFLKQFLDQKSLEQSKWNDSTNDRIQTNLADTYPLLKNNFGFAHKSISRNPNSIISFSSINSLMQISAENSSTDFIEPTLLPNPQLSQLELVSNLKKEHLPMSFKFTKALDIIIPIIDSPPPPKSTQSDSIQSSVKLENFLSDLTSEIPKQFETIAKLPQKTLQSDPSPSRNSSSPRQSRKRSLSNDRNNCYNWDNQRKDRNNQDQDRDRDDQELQQKRESREDSYERSDRGYKNYKQHNQKDNKYKRNKQNYQKHKRNDHDGSNKKRDERRNYKEPRQRDNHRNDSKGSERGERHSYGQRVYKQSLITNNNEYEQDEFGRDVVILKKQGPDCV